MADSPPLGPRASPASQQLQRRLDMSLDEAISENKGAEGEGKKKRQKPGQTDGAEGPEDGEGEKGGPNKKRRRQGKRGGKGDDGPDGQKGKGGKGAGKDDGKGSGRVNLKPPQPPPGVFDSSPGALPPGYGAPPGYAAPHHHRAYPGAPGYGAPAYGAPPRGYGAPPMPYHYAQHPPQHGYDPHARPPHAAPAWGAHSPHHPAHTDPYRQNAPPPGHGVPPQAHSPAPGGPPPGHHAPPPRHSQHHQHPPPQARGPVTGSPSGHHAPPGQHGYHEPPPGDHAAHAPRPEHPPPGYHAQGHDSKGHAQSRSSSPSPAAVKEKVRSRRGATLQAAATVNSNRGFKIRLRNVPPELMAKDLAEAFLAVVTQGRVESVDVVHDKKGHATGEAVVIFSNQTDAQNVVHRYHGGDLNGRRLNVTFQGPCDL